MNEETRTKYFDLKQKRDQLFLKHSELERTTKEHRSTSLSLGNYRAQLEEIERTNNSVWSKIFGKNQPDFRERKITIREKIVDAETRSLELFDDKKRLNSEIHELTNYEIEYEEHLKLIAKQIDSVETENILCTILELENRRSSSKSAYELGATIDNALTEINEKLWESREAGFFDLIGGGFMVSSWKYSKLDSSKNQLEILKEILETYVSHLEKIEINIFIPNQQEISNSLKLNDYIFGGMIWDGMVLKKIETMLSQFSGLQTRVKEIQKQLKEMIPETTANLLKQQHRIIELANLESQN